MPNHMDTAFSPSLYLDRDKNAIAFVEDQLLHQESCAAACMYGNGKDYLFTNVVKRFQHRRLPYKLKILNTISSDELRDFADMLEAEAEPTLCLVNLRMHKDVSWFIRAINELRVKRGHAFASFVCAYVGDIYQALIAMESPVAKSLVILKRVPYEDALHILDELSERFEFYPSKEQKRDIYDWSYGHVGLLRTLYILKRQAPEMAFTRDALLREPAVLERLQNIVQDIPAQAMQGILQQRLTFVEKTFFEQFGYTTANGELFHPLLLPLVAKQHAAHASTLSPTEQRVLAYLRYHSDSTVSREDIGRIVWGEEEWEDKYSDWAIGQLVYRLRRKLAYSAMEGKIETRKGKGFAYVQLVAAGDV